MKTLMMISAILTVIAGGVCFYLFPSEFAVPLFLFCIAVAGSFVYSCSRDAKLRKHWLLYPVFPDSPEFDQLFWKMTMSNQDWYIENILKKEGLEHLIEKYETTVRQIWNDRDWEVSEKIQRSAVYVGRLKALITSLEFNYKLRAY